MKPHGIFFYYTSVDTEMCCPKGKCGCQYFILLTLKKKKSSAPLEKIAMDILGPLPTSARGNKYILVIADYFTKWTEALRNHKANTTCLLNIFRSVSLNLSTCPSHCGWYGVVLCFFESNNAPTSFNMLDSKSLPWSLCIA
jgi:hypothetical protein